MGFPLRTSISFFGQKIASHSSNNRPIDVRALYQGIVGGTEPVTLARSGDLSRWGPNQSRRRVLIYPDPLVSYERLPALILSLTKIYTG